MRFPGVVVLLGASVVVWGALLPWVVAGSDVQGMGTGAGQALLVGTAIIGGMLGLGLMFGGAATALEVGAAVAGFAAVIIVLVSYAKLSPFSIPSFGGPGAYVAGIGALFWTIGAMGALIADDPVAKRNAEASARVRGSRPSQ